jgi:uncharacterized protein (TIGR03435 family)
MASPGSVFLRRLRSTRFAAIALGCLMGLVSRATLDACTAFCAVGGGRVLVGNNEDWSNPRTRLWFVPAKPGSFGRMYVGFDDRVPQGGMNEHGLWFDGFAAPAIGAAADAPALPRFDGNLVDTAMAQCKTVGEVVDLFSRYDRGFLVEGILMFADASGDAVAIERNAIVRKTARHFVQTNFHLSGTSRLTPDRRFATATSMLERAGDEISIELARQILDATHQKGGAPTLYSNIYDLQSRTMHLYYFHDFTRAVTFNLAEELEKGERILDIPSLFPSNPAAEALVQRQSTARRLSPPVLLTMLFAIAAVVVAAFIVAWLRGGRRVRWSLAAGALAAVLLAVAATTILRLPRGRPLGWLEFSIGPAAGDSVSITPTAIRANGITLQSAIAVAYDVPAVRVVSPAWVKETRYSLTAIADAAAGESFRAMLRQELRDRLRLEAHAETRPFDVLVLTASDAPRLERSNNTASTWMQPNAAQLQHASMDRLATALQSVLGRPVVDETGITGGYYFELQWEADPLASLTATLRDRFGLHLQPARRELEALVVDVVDRDAALLLLGNVGRMTRSWPPELRQILARALAIQ